MYLERVEIVGFRGIRRLSLTLDENTVLIGENAWGKSSLLDALTLLLSSDEQLYHFSTHDFYFPPGEEEAKERTLQIVFTFCERETNSHNSDRYRRLSPVFIKGNDRCYHIYLRYEGELCNEGVCTWRDFLNRDGSPIKLHNVDELIKELIRLHPVLRLRDARFMRRFRDVNGADLNLDEVVAERLNQLTKELVKRPQSLTNRELRDSLDAMKQLLEHYFSEQGAQQLSSKRYREHQRNRHHWYSLEKLNKQVAESSSRTLRMLVLGVFSSLLQAKGAVRFDPEARPLLLMEDPETRLHPVMLSIAWGLIAHLPLQRVTTTNSGDLLSLIPLEEVCRLVRESSKVNAYRIDLQGMSPEEYRRIAFHIRFNRASALFSRCWLLVEGETEVWLLGEMARLCGYHLEAEGVKIIEFAQSGLKPLLKFARSMGIEWHVLVDGDEAGKKYASTVKSFADRYGEPEQDRLTALPARDMEFFMYNEGFSHVYHSVATIPQNAQIPARRVIQKAIHHSSKPDLAIAVAVDAAKRGGSSVPSLLKKMLPRVIWLARGKAD